ncbi:hypothetical protein Trydic_g16686 [Trypoxylus dichotomus]
MTYKHAIIVTAATEMFEHINSHMDKSTLTVAIIIHTGKVLDEVWHDGLIHKMRLHRIPATLTPISFNTISTSEPFLLEEKKTSPLLEQPKQESPRLGAGTPPV